MASIVAMVREVIASVGSEMNTLHSSVQKSTDRFDAIGQITDARQIKARLVAEVMTLKQLTVSRQKAWQDTARGLGERIATLEGQLVATQTEALTELTFLSLAYAGVLVQQPNLCAVCLDTGRTHAGAVFGFMNTAANAASAVSSVVFGYLVAYSGSYNAPFIPMVALLCFGSWLWLKVDPSHEIFAEEHPRLQPWPCSCELGGIRAMPRLQEAAQTFDFGVQLALERPLAWRAK